MQGLFKNLSCSLTNQHTEIYRSRIKDSKMGQIAPGLADDIAAINEKKRGVQTKENYVSVFRHWVNWNLSLGLEPLEMPLDPSKCRFWIQERINMSGSIASLSTWKTLFHWLSELAGAPLNYKRDPEYIQYIKDINKLYHKGKDHRLPFTVRHIEKYTNTLWDNDINKFNRVTYDNVIRILLANAYFFTMSRPAELLKTSSSSNRSGLMIKDMHERNDRQHKIMLYELDISNYKNAASRLILKKIYIADTACALRKKCRSYRMNTFALITLMIRRRRKIITKLLQELKTLQINSTKYKEIREQLDGLLLTPNNPLFVWENGKEVTTKDLTNISKGIANVNEIMDKSKYTSYSLRIGGTTTASLAGIEHPLILKYVGWSNSRLADCAQRYMRYSPFQLCQVPFKMLHGKDAETRRNIDCISMDQIYDPWSEKLKMKYYRN